MPVHKATGPSGLFVAKPVWELCVRSLSVLAACKPHSLLSSSKGKQKMTTEGRMGNMETWIPRACLMAASGDSHSKFKEEYVGCLNLGWVELESHARLMGTVINCLKEAHSNVVTLCRLTWSSRWQWAWESSILNSLFTFLSRLWCMHIFIKYMYI
jgi:hypothetical protein